MVTNRDSFGRRGRCGESDLPTTSLRRGRKPIGVYRIYRCTLRCKRCGVAEVVKARRVRIRMDAALVISIIALVLALVALPPTFQMFFGRPRLRARFTEQNRGDGKLLLCEISNAPVAPRVLHLIGVHRESATIFADFRVREVGSEKVIVDTTRALLADIVANGAKGELRARLDDHFPMAFLCAIHLNNAQPAIMNVHKNMKTILSSGRYRVDVEITCGVKLYCEAHELSVGTKPGETYWMPV
jgi:hypothetical protein